MFSFDCTGETGRELTTDERAIRQRLSACRAELSAVQSRLGTSEEQSGDLERAGALAHEVANLLTAINLRTPASEGSALLRPRAKRGEAENCTEP